MQTMATVRKWRVALRLAALFALAPVAHAQVYKWTDGAGKVHYTDNKDEADRAKGRELKVAPGPTEADRDVAQQDVRRREEEARVLGDMSQSSFRPPRASPDRSVARPGRGRETDQSRCKLARSFKGNLVQHQNGAKTDANDSQLVDQAVADFCR
jgi:hypothetical protein